MFCRNAVLIMKRFCRELPAERLGYQKNGIMDIKRHKWFQVTSNLNRDYFQNEKLMFVSLS